MRKHITTAFYKAGWAALCLSLTALTALLLYQSIMAVPASILQEPWLDIGLELAIISLITLSLLVLLLPLPDTLRSGIILGLLSLFLLGIMTFVLQETPYPFGGLQGDQRFYATYVTKLATYAGYPDVMYRDLPTFYPPLYYYLLGQGARLLAVEPYEMLKLGLLFTAFGLPFLMAGLWRILIGHRAAILITFALVVVPNWFKPAEWISEVLFVPWWLYWVMNVTQHQAKNSWQRVIWYGLGGLVGGLLFQNYYYWFFIGGVSLAVSLVDSWRTRNSENHSIFNFTNIFLMLASAALFSSNYWWPYLYSMYTTGGWMPLQNRWLTSGKIELPFPFIEFSLSGGVAMLGLITLWLGSYVSPLCRGLRNLFIAAYLWLLLGYVGILLDQPLLSFRAYPLIEHLLIVGALLGWAGFWFPELAIWPPPTSERLRKAGQRIVPIVGISLLTFFVADIARDLKDDKQIARAIEASPPEALLQTFDRLSAGNSKSKTMWADIAYNDLFAYRPLYTFLPWSAHFSHPAGLFHQRVALLEALATTHSPTLFAAALMNNRYDPIDHIMLKQSNGQHIFSYSEDNFPNRTRTRTLAYPTDLFSPTYFEIRQDNAYGLFQPKLDENPLSYSLLPTNETPNATLALWHSLHTTFGEHVALPAAIPNLVEIEQQLAASGLADLSKEILLDLNQGATGSFGEQVRMALVQELQTNTQNYQPLDLVLMDQVGSHKLQIVGYAVEPLHDVAFNLTLYFQVLSPLDHDYLIWLHAFQEGGKLILDHAPVVPTTGWEQSKIYRDSYTINLSANSSHIEFGFWNQEKDVRLVQPSWEMGVRLEITDHAQP